jgi:hypothetical protein
MGIVSLELQIIGGLLAISRTMYFFETQQFQV